MRLLFLVPYPSFKAPSQRFRFEQYYAILNTKRFEFKVQSFLTDAGWEKLYTPDQLFKKTFYILFGFLRRVWILFFVRQYDYIFIHREAAPIGPPIFEWIIANVLRKKIVYDFDDAIWIPNISEENKIAAKLKWHQKVPLVCRWSYKVSCGNDYLCEFAGQFNSRIVCNPTTIDTENLHRPGLYDPQKNTKEKLVLGWTGTHSTLPYLNEVVPVLSKLEERYDFYFLVIANKNPKLPLKSFKFIPWNIDSEIVDLSSFDIGIMPLTEDQWSAGKCGFKALQYMALEIPALVSPVGVNKKVVEHGVNGFHCATSTEWERYLIKLIEDNDLRKQMGSNGRKKVENNFSIKSNQDVFLSLFE